jgi:hypothetical protein
MYGIKEVYYHEVYDRDDFSVELAKEFGISLIKI